MEVTKLYTNAIFDSVARKLVTDQVITVSTKYGIILDVKPYNIVLFSHLTKEDEAQGIKVLDLRDLTILPGFVDVHVHMFLHAYNEVSWTNQNTQENVIERTIRATVAAKKTLLSGFTTVRDLGTEGAGDADISLRKCISEGIIPGPRYFTANRAIVSTGAYGPKSNVHLNQEGVEGITGAEAASGPQACVEVVRRQIGAGADWIKLYADYRPLGRQAPAFPGRATLNLPLFSREEMAVIIDTAHAYGVRVAAHASNYASIATLLPLGVDSVEHGYGIYLTLFRVLRNSTTTWVPTLSVMYTHSETDNISRQRWRTLVRAFQAALREGLDEHIACGGDTGPFPHGDNALEMQLMRRLGASWEKVLQWGTLGGYRCIAGGKIPFGVLRPGWAADIVGVRGVLNGSVEEFEKAVSKESVSFVMKAGVVYKTEGKVAVV
uniref:Amidohydrolase-related domain-containing protein n=1 Tax=Schizophyllum commune (strain H4-8 / FGSC 9210) TaxID=578458 RepID=D8Q271_SCHCM